MTREVIIASIRRLNDAEDALRAISVAARLLTERVQQIEGDLVRLLRNDAVSTPPNSGA